MRILSSHQSQSQKDEASLELNRITIEIATLVEELHRVEAEP